MRSKAHKNGGAMKNYSTPNKKFRRMLAQKEH
jgi:hypothetical protein